MVLWFPVGDHPGAPSPYPWYRIGDDGLVYAADGHPSGASDHAHFRVHGDEVFAYDDHRRSGPLYVIRGSMVYRADTHGDPPRYQLRNPDDL